MSLPSYDPFEKYTGTGLLTDYSFEFKINAENQLEVIVLNASGVLAYRERGSDAPGTHIASVDFDAKNGGGTVTLQAALPNDYSLIILLATDSPTQDYEFRDQHSFTLRDFEQALDFLGAPIQRAIFLALRSIRLNDADVDSAFDMQLPLSLTPRTMLMIGDDGLSFEEGPTPEQLSQAATDATAAAASAAASAASATAAAASAVAAAASAVASDGSADDSLASAVDAAASAAAAAATAASFTGFLMSGPFAVLENNNSNLLNEFYDHAVYTQVDFIARIVRGTTVFARQEFSIFYRNGAWELANGEGRYFDTAHGVTFTVNAATGQINAAVDNSGAGDATIDLKKVRWAI